MTPLKATAREIIISGIRTTITEVVETNHTAINTTTPESMVERTTGEGLTLVGRWIPKRFVIDERQR
jgi:hypothetical protein